MVQPKVMIIGSGSASDGYAGHLGKALQTLWSDISLLGVGGPIMAEMGIQLLHDVADLDSMGIVGSIRGSHVMKRLVQRVSDSMERLRPDVVIQIGLPVFQLRLVELAHAKGIPVVYYYTPLSWNLADMKMSWFAKAVHKVVGVTRTETQICQQAGLAAEFVGHPLVDLVGPFRGAQTPKSQYDLAEDEPVVTLFPGRRSIEVRTLLPTLLRACSKIREEEAIQVVVAQAPGVSQELIHSLVPSGELALQVVPESFDLYNVSDLAVVTSGNATLEAALMQTPSLAVYKVPTTTYLRDKMLARQSCFSMVNSLLQSPVMPELIQGDFTESRVAAEMAGLLHDSQAVQAMQTAFSALDDELGEPGSIVRAAHSVAAVVDELL